MQFQQDVQSDRPVLGGLLVFGAIVLGTMVITLSQSSPPELALAQGWGARIDRAIQSGTESELLDQMNDAIRKDPVNDDLHLARGTLHARTGKIEMSLLDFDKVIELSPDSKPYLWQRGISLYYAGKYKEGKEQFETHRTVNPNDVENAFWHFLCSAKIQGVETASKDILTSGLDRRAPMMQVQQMIAGKMTPEQVVEISEKGDKSTQFYGFLYLALYADVSGQQDKAIEYLEKCLNSEYYCYMYDVAKYHAKVLKSPPKQAAESQ